MRPIPLALPLLAIAALGLLAAPAVMADGEGAGAADAGKARAAEKRANATEARAAHANDTDDEGNETDDGPRGERGRANETRGRSDETHGRPAHVTTFVERMQALRLAWHENATKVREDCRAAAFDHANATGNETRAHAHCIRDGYKDLRAWLLAEITAAREDFRAAHETWRAEQRARGE